MKRSADHLAACVLLAALLSCVAVLAERASAGDGEQGRSEPAVELDATTFDGAAFRYRMEPLEEAAAYRVFRLSYASPVTTPTQRNNTIPAEYYLPNNIVPGEPRRPAVICLHILNGNFELVRLTCSTLAARGIPALWFKMPYYGERGLPGGRAALARDPKLFADALSQALADVRRTVDVLASRPEIDPRRIGVMGISLGGIVAASAAAQEPRIARAVFILAGGDLNRIVHHTRETRELSEMIRRLPDDKRAEVEAAIDAIDPLRHAAKLRDRALAGKVLMINATEDNVIPPPCTERLAAALGIQDRVVWLEGLGHYTALAALPRTLQATADFFAEDLPPDARREPPAPRQGTPLHTMVEILRQAGSLLTSQPGEGRCHLVDLEFTVTMQDEKKVEGRLRLASGAEHKFAIHVDTPLTGKVALGQGEYPWIASGQKVVFRGTLAPDTASRDPLSFVDPEHLQTVRLLSGVLGTLAFAPDMLRQWIVVEEIETDRRKTAILVRKKDAGGDDFLRIELRDDATTPAKITFEVAGVTGSVTVLAWQFNTVSHDGLFQEPDGLPIQDVDATDLYRMASAAFNFALESVRQ